MKNYHYTFLFLFFLIGNAKGQFDPITNYHQLNPFFYNPAMAGIENEQKLHVGMSFRSPADHGTISYEQPFTDYNSNIGVFSRTFVDYYLISHKFGLAYNYTFHLAKQVSITPGFQFTNISVDGRPHKIDLSTIRSNWTSIPNFDLGLVLRVQKLKLGISAIDVRNTTKRFATVYGSIFTPESYRSRIWSATASYDLKFTPQWSLNASMFVYDFFEKKGKTIYDWFVLFNRNEKIYIGLAYRRNDQVDKDFKFRLFLGAKLWKKLSIFFSTNLERDGKRYHQIEPMIQYNF